jgi:exopolyphosphatase/pppGpp-phosphohydrolase
MNRPDPAVLASLAAFLAEKERERRAIHRKFSAYWAMLRRTGVWDELAGAVTEKRKNRYRPPKDLPVGCTRERVVGILATCPQVSDHSRTVTRLSLMLFDAIAPLHKLGRRDRFLLECAALLHDIGWTGGRAGHGRRGAARVLGDGSLPFDLCERGSVPLAISCHRGQKTPAGDPLFSLLPEDCRKRSMVLAAILRVADGLDYLHTGNVQEVHAVIGRDAVVLDILPGTGCNAEKARAQAKASLASEVFGLPLVIR